MKKVYEYSKSPPFWIVEDEDGYWLVPARDGGWEERAPFFGRVSGLRQLADTGAIAPGWPGDE